MEFQNFMLLRKYLERICYDILALLIKAEHFFGTMYFKQTTKKFESYLII